MDAKRADSSWKKTGVPLDAIGMPDSSFREVVLTDLMSKTCRMTSSGSTFPPSSP